MAPVLQHQGMRYLPLQGDSSTCDIDLNCTYLFLDGIYSIMYLFLLFLPLSTYFLSIYNHGVSLNKAALPWPLHCLPSAIQRVAYTQFYFTHLHCTCLPKEVWFPVSPVCLMGRYTSWEYSWAEGEWMGHCLETIRSFPFAFGVDSSGWYLWHYQDWAQLCCHGMDTGMAWAILRYHTFTPLHPSL